jgi:carboxypeptidase Taq
MDSFDQLRKRLGDLADVKAASALLSWDQETYMPAGAGAARAQQLATLGRLAHEMFVSDEFAAALAAAAADVAGAPPDSDEARIVRVIRRDHDKATRLPAQLVADLAQATALAQQAWAQARPRSDFESFRPHLERVLELTLTKAEALGYEESPYDALLDDYEPDMKASQVAEVFAALRSELVPIVQGIAAADMPDDTCLRRHFDATAQWEFGEAVIRDFGFDFDRGRQDRSAHPFSTNFAVSDVRITTRVDESFLPTALFGTLHEAGHAMYEQGVDEALARTGLDNGTSLGIHESQSRLWENQVGRSRAFWKHYYGPLQRTFGAALGEVPLDEFYRAVNRVEPSLIRVEADEVTYNLHVMIRFELEMQLVTGALAVADLPEAWNAAYERTLGLRPPDDAQGVLQDIHWSFGLIGYFPTYTLGTLISAQLFEQAQADLGDLDDQLGRGEFAPLREWLRAGIHRHGRKFTASELLERTTGGGLDAAPWLRYVRAKFGELYGF